MAWHVLACTLWASRVTSGQKEPHSSAQSTCNPQGEILLTFSPPIFAWPYMWAVPLSSVQYGIVYVRCRCTCVARESGRMDGPWRGPWRHGSQARVCILRIRLVLSARAACRNFRRCLPPPAPHRPDSRFFYVTVDHERFGFRGRGAVAALVRRGVRCAPQ